MVPLSGAAGDGAGGRTLRAERVSEPLRGARRPVSSYCVTDRETKAQRGGQPESHRAGLQRGRLSLAAFSVEWGPSQLPKGQDEI